MSSALKRFAGGRETLIPVVSRTPVRMPPGSPPKCCNCWLSFRFLLLTGIDAAPTRRRNLRTTSGQMASYLAALAKSCPGPQTGGRGICSSSKGRHTQPPGPSTGAREHTRERHSHRSIPHLRPG